MRRGLQFSLRAIGVGALLSAANVVNAQAPQQAPAPAAPETSKGQSADKPLSKKLDENDGVLTPPRGIDPEIHQAPPANTGDKMPVIVPPGEPGGDQSVQPK